MSRNQHPIRIALCSAASLLLCASLAHAQNALDSSDDGPEIVRDGDALRDGLRPRDTDDHDIADTALVFTNLGGEPARVRCVAYNDRGHPIGRAWTGVPALGLRYMLASDLAYDRDFIGHVQCGTLVSVKGTAVFIGQGVLTDLPSLQPHNHYGRIRFPVVATY